MAAVTFRYPPLVNAIQKSLDSQLDAGVTASMTLNNTTNIQNKPGVCVVDRIDSSGTLKSTAVREFIAYAGTSGATLTTLTRNVDNSSSDQDHAVGAIVEFIPDVTFAQAILDALDGTKSGVQLLTPQIDTSINDTNGNEIIKTPATTSAVNEITVTNAATGNAPQVSATGDDTNIDLNLIGKGTGKVKIGTVGLKFPNSDGSDGQFLKTDGAGALSFATAAGKVLQVVNATYATNTTSSLTSYSDTGLTASITPSSASSKILVLVNQAGLQKNTSDVNNGISLQLLRGSTVLSVFATAVGFAYGGAFALIGSAGTTYLDSPATTSSVTYKTQQKGENTNTIGTQANSGKSSITLIEIAG